MEMTGDLFAEAPQPSAPRQWELIIGRATKAPLTKAQQAFNRLIKKIEKLRQSIEEETARLNGLLSFYTAELHPLEVQILQQRKTLVRRLFPYLRSREIPGRQQRTTLRALITENLDQIVAGEGELKDDDLKSIRDEIAKSMPMAPEDDEGGPGGLEDLKGIFEADFKRMGVDVDLSRFRPGMSPHEFFETLADVESQLKSGGSGKPEADPFSKPRRETREEVRARMEEELRQRDLGSLYKQLAKLLHPDLESDPILRVEKEAAMKELTTAYKKKDLHAILRLELEWISREQADAGRLTDEKLRVYNGILKEQVAELQARLQQVAYHPRFLPLARYEHPFFGPGQIDGRSAREELTTELAGLSDTVEWLNGPKPAEAVRSVIREARQESKLQGQRDIWF